MENLISMTEFVLEESKKLVGQTENFNIALIRADNAYRFEKYANFLNQPLELWMFVPCDQDGNVLPSEHQILSCEKGLMYGIARERCLFEGAHLVAHYPEKKLYFLDLKPKSPFSKHGSFSIGFDYNKDKTIENLIHLNLKLTETAKKQIFG